ncbi:MAG: hypothetical protein KJ558_12025 [Gammaproteobacteria bacterium]|nr:hypothetical protein [Gammaproteobacteria bacterium]MBU1655531.1 hypothetical protein [Gammaproteobacteria bacterium]MBU1961279.1 hypothetical protein [Gammaproteobacteria bacterium]
MSPPSTETEATIARLEREMWHNGIDLALLEHYQRLCREREASITRRGSDDRCEFLVVIPVADRPQQLRDCLASLLCLCRTYAYGGFVQGRYPKIAVLIADDSSAPANIEQNRAIAANFTGQGLETRYFGLEQQGGLLRRLRPDECIRLSGVIGDTAQGSTPHKGASIMRNLSYLKLRDLEKRDRRQLFYFIDSDQEFKVRVDTPGGERDLYAINYFHHLDRLFAQTDIALLTGKVVGDPPVSPAVMAGNFLSDLVAFLSRMAAVRPEQPCSFHKMGPGEGGEAAYHDMADLFGFKSLCDPFQYRCTLDGEHDQAACFKSFAGTLSHFFDGAHPTRKSYYEYQDVLASLRPARTVYTGNYIFRPEYLAYFIPFAPLKLRMAGPVLGRILRAELDERFVSANLPMLHKRTLRQTGQSEFRPGVRRTSETCDISLELERQFYGDLVLFTLERLSALDHPSQPLSEAGITGILNETLANLYREYRSKQSRIAEGLARLSALFDDGAHWWNQREDLGEARGNFTAFIGNIERNFGAEAKGYALIGPGPNREQRLKAISEAILRYPEDRAAWHEILARFQG